MGYYTSIEMSLAVKPEKRKEFEGAFVKQLDSSLTEENEWFDRYEDLGLDAEGYLQFQEYERKFDDAERLAAFLSPYVEAGEIRCWGEDTTDIWRVVFDGHGRYEVQKGRLVYEGKMKLPDEE